MAEVWSKNSAKRLGDLEKERAETLKHEETKALEQERVDLTEKMTCPDCGGRLSSTGKKCDVSFFDPSRGENRLGQKMTCYCNGCDGYFLRETRVVEAFQICSK